MGFCEVWIDWMMLCVKTVSYTIFHNGALVRPIVSRKGLRQGEPLSLYLFLLCVEGLSNAIDKASSNGMNRGCQISPKAPRFSHLYADDSFLFFQANTNAARSIKNLLVNYEKY